ncbi:MAG: glycosyltransferase [Verrucomicrobiota bacterium]|nr:glycosyltransferase [Verrucomicrobiota bacterium]
MELRSYQRWIAQHDSWSAGEEVAWRRRVRQLRRQPVISVLLPVYNPDLGFLEAAINSVREQVYENWQLCIADDASTDASVRPLLEAMSRSDLRVRVVFRPQNGHIAACTNSALGLATGDWCALLDQDDVLRPHSLAAVACEIERHPDAGVFYSDEDKIDAQGHRSDAYFKSDWNPQLFFGHNMVSHLGVYRSTLLREIGGFREGFEGSQDYDLVLRCSERLRADQIRHIPHVLYHWRTAPGSVAGDSKAKPYANIAARKAIADHLSRRGIAGRVEPCPEEATTHRVIFEIPDPPPLVSIVIPTRDRVALLRRCIESIREKTDYGTYEFVIVDNGSIEHETHAYLGSIADEFGARVVRDNGAFNFSRLINRGVAESRGSVLALLNNDTEVENRDWLREMVSRALLPETGAVGARLWLPDGTIQHAGVVVGLGGVAAHAMFGFPRRHPGYFSNLFLARNCTAVTAACMVLRKETFEQVGGFDEVNLPVNFNDVDFCLRLRALGLQIVWTPYANLIHHESASRGQHGSAEEQARFFRESRFMLERWSPELRADPFYNPNLTLDYPGFDLAFPPRL